MRLQEGKNNWVNFGQDHLKSIELYFDGEEELSLAFYSTSDDDCCKVVLDWEEEINSFQQLFTELYYREERQCKLYPDDFRGLMLKGVFLPDGLEMTFLKNYQCVRVIMGLDKSRSFLQTLEKMLKEPGKYKLNFETQG